MIMISQPIANGLPDDFIEIGYIMLTNYSLLLQWISLDVVLVTLLLPKHDYYTCKELTDLLQQSHRQLEL